MSTTNISRPATIGLVGGALWALLPVAWSLAAVDHVEFGTRAWFTAAATYWIFLVLPPALVLAGLVALRRAFGDDVGRTGRIGMAVAGVGMAAMALGNGIEVVSITAGGDEVALGHATFLIGFLVSIVGWLVTGAVVLRRRRDTLSRAAGVLLVLALPLGIGIGVLGSAVDPNNDAWFWAAIAVPTGVAWILLGTSLGATHRPAAAEMAAVS